MLVKLTYMEKDQEPVQIAYEYDRLPPAIGGVLIQVSVGDPISRGSVTIPHAMLTMLMGNLMGEVEKRKGALLVPDNKLVGFDQKKGN